MNGCLLGLPLSPSLPLLLLGDGVWGAMLLLLLTLRLRLVLLLLLRLPLSGVVGWAFVADGGVAWPPSCAMRLGVR